MTSFCLLESWLIREAGFLILTRRKEGDLGDAKDKSCSLNWYDGMWDCMMGCAIVSCVCCVWYLNLQYDREGNGVSWECRARVVCEGSARERRVGKYSNIECILSRFTK